MASATLNLRIQPYRLMTQADAAHYCRRKPTKFRAECPVRPIRMPNGDELFDVQDLDRWIDSLKAGGHDDADDIIGKL